MRASLRAALVTPALAALVLAGCAGDESSEPADDTASETTTDGATASDGATAGEGATGSEAPVALPDPVDLPEGVAATVGETEVSTETVDERVALQAPEETGETDAAAQQALTQLVQVELVSQAAVDQLGLDVAAEIDGPAISARTAELIESAGGQEAFEASAAAQGIAAENATALAEIDAEIQLLIELVRDALAEDLPEDAVDAEALRAEYDADPSAYQSSDVAHILVETEEEAEEALARLEDGEDFGELARELSTGPSGPDGGELGLQPRGTYVEEFAAAVYADDVESGEVVGPVETQFGWHLIRVNEIITQSFDEVLAGAREAALEPVFQEFVEDSFSAVEVVIDEQYGVWDATNSAVVAAG